MSQTVPPIFNGQLFCIAQADILPKGIMIPYTCEPDSVGIAVLEATPNIYRVYCTNEHGALDWEQIYYDFAQALGFAQEFYVCYTRFLYGSNVSTKAPSKNVIQLNRRFSALSDSGVTQYQIVGKNRLEGEISVGGSVYAGLAILSATVLVNGPCCIDNLSLTTDIQALLKILAEMGAAVRLISETTVEIDCSTVKTSSVPFGLATNFWASCYLVGAMLGRFGEAEVPLARDSGFYARPINPHIQSFIALGATVDVNKGRIHAQTAASHGLVGTSITLDAPSESVTVNLMLAGTLAQGKTVIQNAARDPSIVDLANFLNSTGADIVGAGTNIIKIRGVNKLTGGTYSIIPDQVEAGTYMAAVTAVGGSVVIRNVIPNHLKSISFKLREMGAKITNLSDAVLVDSNEKLRRTKVCAIPYPGFSTDMQPQIAACMATAEGSSLIIDSIVETGFPYIEELKRFGVSASIDRDKAIVDGVETLYGCPVYAHDPYSGAAIVIAGLSAEGTTEIRDIYHIKRQYNNMVEKLKKVGANIEEIKNTDELKQKIPKTS